MLQQVLVTGASSVLMQEVCKNLLNHNLLITGVSRAHYNIAPNIYADWISADLSSSLDTIPFNQFQTIIHAAACTHAFSFEDYKKMNIEVTQNIVSKAKTAGVENFILISSRAAVKHGGWYAETKLAAEKIVLKSFPNATIIRPSEIYGGTKQEGIDALIEQVKHSKFIFYPLGINDRLYPIHITDASKYIAEIIRNSSKGVHTINGSESFTLPQLIQQLSSIFQRKIILIPIPSFIIKWACAIQKTLQLRIGIYPDQFKRLKAPKENTSPPSYIRSIQEVFESRSL